MKRRISIVLWALIALFAAVPMHAQFSFFWNLSENQLNIEEGGRVNTIAVNPDDTNERYVASETGGLFKSLDGGRTWKHVDKLEVTFTQSVVYLRATGNEPAVILVSAKADFKYFNGGGVWRSADGGDTWEHTLKNAPGRERMSAYDIAVYTPGAIYVGTSSGFTLTTDRGSSWNTPFNVFGTGDKTVISLLATRNVLYLGGPSGVRMSSFLSVMVPANDPGPIRDLHAFAPSPLGHVLVANAARQLFVTQDDGNLWTRIASAPEGIASCGGTPFIKTVDRTASGFIDLYFSNRCGLFMRAAPVADNVANYFGPWTEIDVQRDHPRDLAFDGNTPRLVGTALGLRNKAAGATVWRLVGGGREGGYNALQINEVKGQRFGQQPTDLYIGARDTRLWASTLDGNIINSRGLDGHYLEVDRFVEPDWFSKITFVNAGRNEMTDRYFGNPDPWLNAPNHRGAPALVETCGYVQTVKRLIHSFRAGMSVTQDCGANWEDLALFREQPTDHPKTGRRATTDPATIVYQPYKRNALDPEFAGASQLIRIEKPDSSSDPGTAFYPDRDMQYLGGLGLNATGFGGYVVYGVDPNDPLHIIAPDVVNQRMMETSDGGETWQTMASLTSVVVNNGSLLFNTDLQGPVPGKVFPVVTAISISPQDPRLILVGNSEGGIFATYDQGASWYKVPGSDHATYVTSFFWENANTVYVSTFGRGLWKLRNKRIAAPGMFDALCPSCDVVSDSGRRPPFDRSVLVFEGTMLGVSLKEGQLRKVFVTPGSSVVFTGDLKDPQDDITIIESDGRDGAQYEPVKSPDGMIATGVVYTSDDKITGTVFAKAELSLLPPPSDKQVKGSTDSPAEGKPYISLDSSTVEPEEVLELSATDFTAGASYELLVDGVAEKGEVTAGSDGSFTARVTAPAAPGYHSVAVRKAGGDTVIDAAMFFVR